LHGRLPLRGLRGLRHVPAAVGARARRQRHAWRLDHDRLPHPGRARRFPRRLARRPLRRPPPGGGVLRRLRPVLCPVPPPALPFDRPALCAGCLLLRASLPVNGVLGQELSPRHAGIISSLLMGAAWGLGAIILYPIGALADHAGLEVALAALSSLILVGFTC